MITLTETHLVKSCLISPELASVLLPYINSTLECFNIDTNKRVSGFLANLIVETNSFTRSRENLDYTTKARLLNNYGNFTEKDGDINSFLRNPKKLANKLYANIDGNGNDESNDGWNYRGGGGFNLTFRNNYRDCGKSLCIDLENNPELIEKREIALFLQKYVPLNIELKNKI